MHTGTTHVASGQLTMKSRRVSAQLHCSIDQLDATLLCNDGQSLQELLQHSAAWPVSF